MRSELCSDGRAFGTALALKPGWQVCVAEAGAYL